MPEPDLRQVLEIHISYLRFSPGTGRQPVLLKKGWENVAEVFRPPFGATGWWPSSYHIYGHVSGIVVAQFIGLLWADRQGAAHKSADYKFDESTNYIFKSLKPLAFLSEQEYF